MSTPRTLVIYYSLSGHSRDIALTIARSLGADVEEIKSSRSFGTGVSSSLLWQLFKCRVFGAIWPVLSIGRNASDYDVVIIGGPIWVGRLAPPVMAWLQQTNIPSSTRLAVFVTAGRPAPFPRAFADVAALMSRSDLVTAHFPDEAKASEAEAAQVLSFRESVVGARSLAA